MINYDDDDDGDEEQEAKEEILSLTEQQPSPTLPRNPPPSRSISELLWHRELAGTLSYRHPERLSLYRKVVMGDLAPTGEQLACSIAWNATRLQNMILAVGPGTPASLIMTTPSTIDHQHHHHHHHHHAMESSDDDSDSEFEDDDDDDEDDDDDDELDDDHDDERLVTAEERDQPMVVWQHLRDDDDDDDDDDDEDHHHHHHHNTHQDTTANEQESNDTAGNTDGSTQQQPLPPWMRATNDRYAPVPSMRHGGCINTATWLTSPWRLSTVHRPGSQHGLTSSSFSSNVESLTTTPPQPVKSCECPTQLLTSGDDRLVKFWDVSMAMGTANPLHGGSTTICPFSAPKPRWTSDVAKKRWKSYYLKRTTDEESAVASMQLSGSVIPLLTLSTGHRANIFHATPLDWQIGKIATCGADGYLRLSDIVAETTSIVVSPEYDDGGNLGLFSLHSNMCFSHRFLNANTGLLCSERGLKRFDIRLPPREQPSQNLLLGRESYRSCCKACAVYSYSSLGGGGGGDEESAYVFAGGSSATVSLYDLRMTGGDDSSSKVVERYRPKDLDHDAHVSVSGLDISKDRRELLVSYENDQIYTFPIFPHASSAAGPTLKDIQALTDEDGNQAKVVTELCSYGAHLNRFTFLKNAKYAGPNDDYICTGSDSGRAWIYERASGSVVSFLNADRSTCNGVVPHPSLPFFITYGIDSTAKLWRATLPVDSNVDDSAMGRAKCFHQQPYEMSPLVRNWQAVQQFLDSADSLAGNESEAIFPDQVPHSKEMVHRGRLGRAFLLNPGSGSPHIGNDLHNLPQILQQNAFACLRALREDGDEPVRSGFIHLKRRVSSIRLRFQADGQGLVWNRMVPWMFQPKRHVCISKAASSPSPGQMDTKSTSTLIPYGDLVDLVPDNPSDWIPYDPHMTRNPLPCGTPFNVDDYDDAFERYKNLRGCVDNTYSRSSTAASWRRTLSPANVPDSRTGTAKLEDEIDFANGSCDHDGGTPSSSDDSKKQSKERCAHAKNALKILCETATLVKEGGNAALQAGNAHLAANRYDKALQYCAVAFMDLPSSNLPFKGDIQITRHSWTPMLKVLITTRLNLSMCLLRPEIAQPQRAVDQAQLAIKDLKPFGTRKGVIMKGDDEELSTDEPAATYIEAKELQAKAFFRLGSAQYDLGDYAASCRSFEHSAKITKARNSHPNKLVMRRLAEAKRENARQSKRQKKMLKLMFSGEDPDEEKKKATEKDKVTPPDEEHQDEAGKPADEEMANANEE